MKRIQRLIYFLVVGQLALSSFIGSAISPSTPTRVNLKRQYTTLTHNKTSELNDRHIFQRIDLTHSVSQVT